MEKHAMTIPEQHTDMLHEPAMKKIAGGNIQALVNGLRGLAACAHESNAATGKSTLAFLEKDETVEARYVPELIIRVTKVV